MPLDRSTRAPARMDSTHFADPGRALMRPTASLIIVGYPGSGKSTLAATLAEVTGLSALEMGDLVREEAAAHSPPVEPLEHATRTFKHGYATHFASQLTKRVAMIRRPVIIVGPRKPEELDLLTSVIKPVVSVGLSVSPETRRNRQRGRLVDEFHADLLLAWDRRDAVERDWGLDSTLTKVDFMADGSVPLSEVARVVYQTWVKAYRPGESTPSSPAED